MYFLLFYESIKQVIEHNGKRLYGGFKAYDFKRRLGFEIFESHAVYSMRPFLNFV